MRRSTTALDPATRLRIPIAGETDSCQTLPQSKSQASPTTFCWSLALVRPLIELGCRQCCGTGREAARLDEFVPCPCVLRRIFADVRARFESIRQRIDYYTRPVRRGQTASSRQCWGMTNEEFLADFTLAARRHLTVHQYGLFRDHILLIKPGAPGELLQVEQILGKAFAEMQPYSLWPINGYFGRRNRASKLERAAARLSGTSTA